MTAVAVVSAVVLGVDVAGLLTPVLASTNAYLTPTTCQTSNGGMP
jgi:hypothetical protein